MYPVIIKWLSTRDGGRKTIPSSGKYYAVSRFPEDLKWQNNAWSVVFDITAQKGNKNTLTSHGFVHFLMDEAPKERMKEHDHFEIYEGPKKVADVYLVKND